MEKIAIVVLSGTDTHESLGKLFSALMLDSEAIENGDDLRIVFEGAGALWIGEFEKEDHKFHELYKSLKEHITGVCDFCASAFGVKTQIESAGIALLSEYKGHSSMRKLFAEGYQAVIF